MKCKNLTVLFTSGIITLLLYLSLTNNVNSIYAQQQQTSTPTIKITSHITGQKVPIGELTISGISSDDPTTDCQVSVIWNDLRPYQNATATGSGGENNFSNWTFTFTEDYHAIAEEVNRLTSKISCTDTATSYGTKWYSVNVIGMILNADDNNVNLNTGDDNSNNRTDPTRIFTFNDSADADVSNIDSKNNNNCNNENLAISDVNAMGYDGDDAFPMNAFDNNLETRWSHEGIGSWIQFDLGMHKLICSIDIAWYKGDERSNNFAISMSNDGINFKNVYHGTSSGTTLSPEIYDFANVPARFVKLTINGNSDDYSDLTDWAAITEIEVN
jgi:hypothetical protein